ncbi:MAG TPA: hypothetical protein VGW58_01695 [Pyrinomonadaceae bacterium]|nr:hypothetical protein [Pyrinomonadaceae bacterium]
MNVHPLNHASSKKLRQFIATLTAGLFIFASVAPGTSATISIVNTLGPATPDTQFDGAGTAGVSILPFQFIGPKFTLTEPTTLTEIGGFMNNCISIINGVPLCPNTLPFTVQIRPATNGVPDASTVLASFVLSHDNDPLNISYESVAINLLLQPGTYFALFAPQGADQGYLLANAQIPFDYHAGSFQMGFLNPFTGISSVSQESGAVRILGETNVLIDGCDSGVPNTVVPGGLTISDLVADCAEEATNHGQFVSCIAHVANDLKKKGIINGQQKSALQGCAAQAGNP